jgi:hypothetical protein
VFLLAGVIIVVWLIAALRHRLWPAAAH